MIDGMGLARYISGESKDPSTQVGCAVLDPKGRVMGLGYNGFPRGIQDDERLGDRAKKYPMIVHAEANAILNARGGVEGGTLFCTAVPCSTCAGLIIQAGIVEVVSNFMIIGRWDESQLIAFEMFDEAGIKTRRV